MSDTQLVEFPLEDVVKRVRNVIDILPGIGRGLINFQNEVQIRKSESPVMDRDFMLQADDYVEQEILESFLRVFPDDAIHSSRMGDRGNDGEFHWWIDPLDGKRNFIHGLPMYCISVGLCFRDRPVAGIVAVPALSTIYHGIHGSGAFKNDISISVSELATLDRAVISSGLPYNRQEILSSIMSNISAFISTGAGIRRTGSTVLDICWVAEGRFDAMWERQIDPWDLCATSVILQEAGGTLTDFTGKTAGMFSEEVVSSNGLLHEEVVSTIQKAGNLESMN